MNLVLCKGAQPWKLVFIKMIAGKIKGEDKKLMYDFLIWKKVLNLLIGSM